MSFADILFIAGLLLGALALALLPLRADAEPDAADEDAKSIDYRPSVLRALMRQGLTFADIATSPRRNAAFMTDTQQAALMPCTSEQAARHIARRMKARMPGERS